MNAVEEQETQDYREDAPIPPAPEPPAELSTWKLFRAGFGSWSLTQWADIKTAWKENRDEVIIIFRILSVVAVVILGLVELANLSSGGLPWFIDLWFAASLAVTLHWVGQFVYWRSAEEGRRVLGLYKD